jgi:hypothetical protein
MLRRINAALIVAFVLAACASPTARPTALPTVAVTSLKATEAPLTATLTPLPPAATPPIIVVKVDPRPDFAPFIEEPFTLTPALQQDPIDPQMGNVLVPLVLSAEQLQFLAQAGVVASPHNYREFGELYRETAGSNLPVFVTSDALLHAYHLIFDKILRDLEEKVLLDRLQQLNAVLLPPAEAQYRALIGTQWADAARRVWAYVAVGARLADPSLTTPTEIAELVEAELALISAAQGPAPSPIFPLLKHGEDYSQYIPRSHYTRSESLKAYFKAMMWYGRMTFRLGDPADPRVGASETRMALLLTALLRDPQAQQLWADLYDPAAFLVGRSDDLTIHDYQAVMDAVYGPRVPLTTLADEAKLADFIAAAQALPAPRILGLISGDYKPLSAVKGLRLMGQRFVPDAYIFQELIHPKVGNRYLPSGLDVMAVLGSERATQWLQQDPATQYEGYPTQFSKLMPWINGLAPAEWTETAYNGWLYTLRPLVTTVSTPGYPLFMQSVAWQDKQLNAALGSWAELKHDTLLYSKQPYGGLGGGGGGPKPPDPVLAQNYVEPAPVVFARLAALAQMTNIGFEKTGAWNQLDARVDGGLGGHAQRLMWLSNLALKLKAMAEKELSGVALTEDEQNTARRLGDTLNDLEDWANDYNYPRLPAALIADVATDPNLGQVLEVGTGNIHELYVVAPIPQADGSLALTVARGGVYSYYEFASKDRLTDEAWRAQVKAGAAPAQPALTSGFSVPQAARPELQAVIYRFQLDWARMMYHTGEDSYGMGTTFVAPVSEAVQQRAAELMTAMRDRKEYEGRQWINTDYLSFESASADTAVVTVREQWADFLVQYTTDLPFDWYQGQDPAIDPATARRGPYTVEVRYTLSRITRVNCAPTPEHDCRAWQMDNVEELTPRPAWDNP